MREITLSSFKGIKIGHAQDFDSATGCSVIIAKKGAIAGVDVRGGAPGTRETDLLNPINLVDKIHAILLAGGSAFGLDAAAGVMEYLEEKKVGFNVQVARVPIVPGAVLFDLGIGNPNIRPDKEMGYKACIDSEKDNNLMGNVGAGTGATVGKLFGMEQAMKGGLGQIFLQVGDLIVGAVVAVNCFGDVIEPTTGDIIAGTLDKSLIKPVNTEEYMLKEYNKDNNIFSGNTTIGVVITNARLTKNQANKIASMAHNGYGRVIRPAHTMVDGDTIFTMATGEISADVNVIGLLAARVIETAVIRGVKHANSLHGIKSYSDLKK